jgi:hypothetical protein
MTGGDREAILTARWYVQPDDEIGGWCVMPVDEPPSAGHPKVADFLSREMAEHVVELHNAALGAEAERIGA